VQARLRAYTPAEQKAVRAAASSLRPNTAFKAEEVFTTLGVGKALVSVLDADGVPGMVQADGHHLPPEPHGALRRFRPGRRRAGDGMGSMTAMWTTSPLMRRS
jgi:hypothetical protein